MRMRLEKLSGNEARDRAATEEIAEFWQRYEQQTAKTSATGSFDPELQRYRWMIEEYRVSLFAQSLGTAFSISAKRLEKQWQKVAL